MKKFLFVGIGLFLSNEIFTLQQSSLPYHKKIRTKNVYHDAYGYDTVRIPYRWIDISTIGIEVKGLGDDNNAGPFPIGFEFPYYWYRVNKFWVNSNGAISFSSPVVYMPQAQGIIGLIPDVAPPNDLVIPLGGDLNPTPKWVPDAKCYYWTNNKDTLIVSFINFPAWWDRPGVAPDTHGSHTFQIILNKADSSITFQYGRQRGRFWPDAAGNSCGVGIENIAGLIGFQYRHNIIPDSGTAIKFVPPRTTNYKAIDGGIHWAVREENEGIFVFPRDPVKLSASIKNYGNVNLSNLKVFCTIGGRGGGIIYRDSVSVASLLVGDTVKVNFDDWTPSYSGSYWAEVKVDVPNDVNDVNNIVRVGINARGCPGWFMYDSEPQRMYFTHWYGAGGGWGQEFEPFKYPAVVESIKIVVRDSSGNTPIPVFIMDDDGPNKSPGRILWADTFQLPDTGSYFVSIPVTIDTIREGKFYVAVIQTKDSDIRIGKDTVSPYYRRGWEFTGVWAPCRHVDVSNILIRAFIDCPYGIEEEREEKLDLVIGANPGKVIPIRYSIEQRAKVSLKVYNIAGVLVNTIINDVLPPGTYTAKIEKLPSGVYFCRLTVMNKSVTKKLVIY